MRPSRSKSAPVASAIAADLIDAPTAADRLGVSVATIRKWTAEGIRSPSMRKGTRGYTAAPIPAIRIKRKTGALTVAVLYYWPEVEAWARRVVIARRGTIPEEWTAEIYAGHLGGAKRRLPAP